MKDKIRNYLIEHFFIPIDHFNDDLNLLDNWILDSIHLLSLVNYLENEFKAQIEADDMKSNNFSTLNNIISFLHSKLNF